MSRNSPLARPDPQYSLWSSSAGYRRYARSVAVWALGWLALVGLRIITYSVNVPAPAARSSQSSTFFTVALLIWTLGGAAINWWLIDRACKQLLHDAPQDISATRHIVEYHLLTKGDLPPMSTGFTGQFFVCSKGVHTVNGMHVTRNFEYPMTMRTLDAMHEAEMQGWHKDTITGRWYCPECWAKANAGMSPSPTLAQLVAKLEKGERHRS